MDGLAVLMAAACARLGVADGATIVLAVSGGPDSMALLHLGNRIAAEHRWRLEVAHLDHGLRDASDDDAAFVTEAAEALGVPAHVRRTDVAALSRERGDGLEEAGRIARYAFLDEVAVQLGPGSVVMTAHTADDQAETVLLHLARGTGLAGLSGIAERRGRIVRPLLSIRRAELRAALDAEGIEYRLDGTNTDDRFARNRARATLIPVLEGLHAGAVEAIARTATLAANAEAALDGMALSELASRRSADGWITWRPAPAAPIGSRILRFAIGAPYPSAERIRSTLEAIGSKRGGLQIELGAERRALIRSGRVRIVHMT